MKNGMHMVSPRQPTCYLPNNLATAITIKRLSAFSLHPGSIQTSLQRHVDVEQELKRVMCHYDGNEMALTPEFMELLY
jgi:hypothetical protein